MVDKAWLKKIDEDSLGRLREELTREFFLTQRRLAALTEQLGMIAEEYARRKARAEEPRAPGSAQPEQGKHTQRPAPVRQARLF